MKYRVGPNLYAVLTVELPLGAVLLVGLLGGLLHVFAQGLRAEAFGLLLGALSGAVVRLLVPLYVAVSLDE